MLAMRFLSRRSTVIGVVFLAVVGAACILVWAFSETTQQRQQHTQQVLALLRHKVNDTRARAAREDELRARHARDRLWRIVHDTKTPDVWERMVDLAKLYHRGIYPYYRPDIETGHSICRTVILHAPTGQAKTDARVLLFSAPEPEETLDTHPGARALPIEPAGVLTKRAMATKCHRTDPPAGPPRTVLPLLVGRLDPIAVQRTRPLTRPDSQNAHDHGVVKHVAKILTSLPPVADADEPGVQREVEDHIANDCDISDDAKAAALQVMESLHETVDNPVLGLSEQQALARVWRRVVHKDLVVQQLASGLEYGQPVCHSGKMARLAAALDDGESENRVLPMWAIRDQLGTTAAAVRDQVLAGASAAETDAYTAGDSFLKQQMETAFKAKCEDFVKESGVSSTVLRPIVDDLVEYGF